MESNFSARSGKDGTCSIGKCYPICACRCLASTHLPSSVLSRFNTLRGACPCYNSTYSTVFALKRGTLSRFLRGLAALRSLATFRNARLLDEPSSGPLLRNENSGDGFRGFVGYGIRHTSLTECIHQRYRIPVSVDGRP